MKEFENILLSLIKPTLENMYKTNRYFRAVLNQEEKVKLISSYGRPYYISDKDKREYALDANKAVKWADEDASKVKDLYLYLYNRPLMKMSGLSEELQGVSTIVVSKSFIDNNYEGDLKSSYDAEGITLQIS